MTRQVGPMHSGHPSESAGGVLTPSQLACLAAIQDRLIPPEGDLPGAGKSGAAERVDGYLAEQPEWRADLLAALRAIEVAALRLHRRPGDALGEPAAATDEIAATGGSGAAGFLDLSLDERDAVLRAVEAAHPRPFQRLLRLTYTAYYSDAGVQRAGGYATAAPLPRGYAMTTFDESRLEPVKRRGRLWREA